jgi:hypothetical protein
MPDGFYVSFNESLFGTAVAKTVPVLYDNTSAIHPKKPQFMGQVEHTLLKAPASAGKGAILDDTERQQVHRVLRLIDQNFNPEYSGPAY